MRGLKRVSTPQNKSHLLTAGLATPGWAGWAGLAGLAGWAGWLDLQNLYICSGYARCEFFNREDTHFLAFLNRFVVNTRVVNLSILVVLFCSGYRNLASFL